MRESGFAVCSLPPVLHFLLAFSNYKMLKVRGQVYFPPAQLSRSLIRPVATSLRDRCDSPPWLYGTGVGCNGLKATFLTWEWG